jgi:FdhE protein
MSLNQQKLDAIDAILQESPEYGEILSLFRGIFAYVDSQQSATGITFTPDMTNHELRVQGGFPLVTPDNMAVDGAVATAFLAGLLDQVARESREGGEELLRISSLLTEGKFDLPLLLGACLQRDREKITVAAVENGVQGALLEFVLETVLKTALEPLAKTLTADDFAGWQEGTCPVCGSRAGMAELAGEEGRRYLSCCSCFFKWPFKRLECPYCGNADSETLSYFTVDEGATRVDTCKKCTRYLKTRDSRLGHAAIPLEVEDLATLHLDLLAGKEGFERGK